MNLFNLITILYFLLLNLSFLNVNCNENCVLDYCDNDSELLTQLMHFINKNQNLSLHLLTLNERFNKLELRLRNNEEQIQKLEDHIKFHPNTLKKPACVNASGDWTVIQRRKDGSVDFYRTWNEYKEGFGNIMGEFFIGLEKLHMLTDSKTIYELLITMETFGGLKRNASYDHFVVGSEFENYKLKSLGRYRGNAGDSLNYHLDQWFSTKDRKNDQNPYEDCSKAYEGGWWYNECHHSNLNGRYFREENTQKANGIHWYKVTDYNKSLKFVEMKIRPRPCKT